MSPEREQEIRDMVDVRQALAPESLARQDAAAMADLLAALDQARAERDGYKAAFDARTKDYVGALGALGEPCAECGHIDWRSEPPAAVAGGANPK